MKQLSIILLLLIAGPAFAGTSDVSLAWDPPDISTDVAGYRLHHGNASGSYSSSVDVGNVLTYTVKGLADGTYYFAVTAYDEAKNQSGYSNEVKGSYDTTPPASSKNLKTIAVKAIINVKDSSITATVDDIIYYEFPASSAAVVAGVMSLEADGTFRVAGNLNFTSRNSPYYFVDGASGNDTTKAGRLRTDAYATITKAESVITTAPHTVTILPGDYTESVAFTTASAIAGPDVITWNFEPGVIITAGTPYNTTLSFTSSSKYHTFNFGDTIITGAVKADASDPLPAGAYFSGAPTHITLYGGILQGNGRASNGAGITDATSGASDLNWYNPRTINNLNSGVKYKNGTTGKLNLIFGLAAANTGSGISFASNDAMAPNITNFTSTQNSYGLVNLWGANPAPVVKNTILYGNTTSDLTSNGAGSITYSNYGTHTITGTMTHGGATNQEATNPLLTATYCLLPSSPAILNGTHLTIHDDPTAVDLGGIPVNLSYNPCMGAYCTGKPTLLGSSKMPGKFY